MYYSSYDRFVDSLRYPYQLLAYLRGKAKELFERYCEECNLFPFDVVEEYVETPYMSDKYPFIPALAFYGEEGWFTVKILKKKILGDTEVVGRVPKIPGLNWVPLVYDAIVIFEEGRVLEVEPKPEAVLILRPEILENKAGRENK